LYSAHISKSHQISCQKGLQNLPIRIQTWQTKWVEYARSRSRAKILWKSAYPHCDTVYLL
jgi:hypothetical protein